MFTTGLMESSIILKMELGQEISLFYVLYDVPKLMRCGVTFNSAASAASDVPTEIVVNGSFVDAFIKGNRVAILSN